MCGERRGETIDKCDRCIGLFRTGVSVPSSLPATSVRLATATSAVKNKDLIADDPDLVTRPIAVAWEEFFRWMMIRKMT